MPAPEFPEEAGNLMGAFMESGWVMPLLALAEIIGGILVIIPKTRALGAIILFPVILGILLFHITLAPDGLIIAAILALIEGWIIIENIPRYKPMIN